MIEVISIKFKNRGKCYFFAPNELQIKSGEKVIVETAKGLEMADCVHGNHMVMDTAVVQPLRPVIRIATEDDLRVSELNKRRETEAFEICQQKIAEHGLDMKLVDVECNFEGNKTTFFFTSDGRVDFRELVKDLAGIFRNRIELRQIGVRDEAKMIGGIGICGRPYCCNQFLDEFQPVSTKMAKIQSLSLNPAKISGSCGRLMCCLRYEQEAYEDLVKKVPKQGAFVQTKDGYGTAVQVNLLRQTVKVKLDSDSDDTLRLFKANELAAVPGGRPKDGEPLPSVFNYVPEEEEEDVAENPWSIPAVQEMAPAETVSETEENIPAEKKNRSRRRHGKKPSGEHSAVQEAASEPKAEAKSEPSKSSRHHRSRKSGKRPEGEKKQPNGKNAEQPKAKQDGAKPKQSVKPVKIEAKVQSTESAEKAPSQKSGEKNNSSSNHRRRNYHHRPKAKSSGENKQ